jgi:hypothetical protein
MSAPPSASDIQRQEPASRAKTSRIGDFQPSHLEWARPLLQAIFNDRNRRHGKDRKHRRPSARTHRMSAPSSASDVRPQELPPRQRPQALGTFNLQPSTFNLQPSTFNPQPSTFNLQPSTFNPNPQPLTRVPLPIRCEITLLDGGHIARHLDHLEDLLMVRGHIHGVQGIA